MRCPVCKSHLVVTGQEKLETLCEHVECSPVSMKDKYQCSGKYCVTRILNVCWNECGELYSLGKHFPITQLNFIDGNDAPFDSFQRKANVEISKKDDNFTLLEIGKLRVEVVYSYKANKNGDVLKKNWHLRYWVNNILWSFPLGYYLRMFYSQYSKNSKNLTRWSAESMNEHGFNATSFNQSWEYRLTHKIMKIYTRLVHPFMHRKVLKLLNNV